MPGGTTCSVAICKSNSKKSKQMGEHLMFLTFPSDPTIQKEWIRKCYRKDKFDPKFKRICSRHFIPEDYEDELRARMLGYQPKKLKKNAIPSMHLRPEDNTIGTKGEKPSTRTKRRQQKEMKQLVVKVIKRKKDSEPLPTKVQRKKAEERTEADNSVQEMPSCSKDSENDILKRQLEQLRQENALLKKHIAAHANNEQLLQQRIFELEKDGEVSVSRCVNIKPSRHCIKKKTKARWSQQDGGII